MREDIQKRTIKHAWLFLERGATIRSVAKSTGWSKDTVHNDLTLRLPKLHQELSKKVDDKISINNQSKQIRATEAAIKKRKRKKK